MTPEILNSTLREKIEQRVKDAIKSKMSEYGIFEVVDMSFEDMKFDFTNICESIAKKEFDRIIGDLDIAVKIIDEAFLP